MASNLKTGEICKKHTNLSEEDISIIEDYNKKLQSIADLNRADMYIECLTKEDNKAIVVSEAKPTTNESIYFDASWLGEKVSPPYEPGVLRTLWTGKPSFNTLGIGRTETRVLYNEGLRIEQSVVPIKNNNKVIGCLVMSKNIEERENQKEEYEIFKFATDMISTSMQEVAVKDGNLISHLYEALIITNYDGKVVLLSPKAKELIKKTRFKYVEDEEYYFDDLSFEITLKELKACGETKTKETCINDLCLQIKSIPIKLPVGKQIGFVFLINDMTEIKNKERELILKSAAIKEIHHRVKNNLQTIASLLRLQMRKSSDEKLKEALDDSVNRIMSISVIYEILCNQNSQSLNVKEIFEQILNQKLKNNVLLDSHIRGKVRGEEIVLPSDKVTTLALVVNELVQNSLKYAFKGKNKGRIKIRISKTKDNNMSILIKDNGIGIEEEKIKKMSGLGLRIVKTLVEEKLKGDINIKSNNGTQVEISLKLEN